MKREITALRKEIKYIVPISEIYALKRCLDNILRKDSHCVEDTYSVRSLYFESVNNIDYADKMAGIDVRKKVRLRIYNGDDSLCKLELKQKNGEWQHKQSLILSKDEAEELTMGHYETLTKYFDNSGTAIKVYNIMRMGCYRPVVAIEYDRLAYQYPLYDTRITLDMNIRATESDPDIFSPWDNDIPVMYEEAVLEIKHSGQSMGFVNAALSQFDLTQSSYSKYCSGRKVYCDFNY